MTPAARVQAAIEILDQIAAGAASEQALTRWARGARYAGSKDRAAVRDHVFDVVRCRRSYGARGGGSDGRALMIGALRAHQTPLDALFSGAPHAPAPLTDAEQARGDAPDGAAAMDLPDWLWPEFQTSLGAQAKSAARALQTRAGVHLRVNLARTTCAEAIAALATDGIEAHPHPAAETALAVTEGARKVRQAHAYSDGRVELQDAASQALALAIPVQAEDRFLDYCAGGGGKALALAARGAVQVFAHDAAPERMRDLPDRATRAGAAITCLGTHELARQAPFDVVLCDVPCSGSGAWRRAPDGKWALTRDRLAELCEIQGQILQEASALVQPGGVLVYATCSVLRAENDERVDAFVEEHPSFRPRTLHRWPVTAGVFGTDGFFGAILTRDD